MSELLCLVITLNEIFLMCIVLTALAVLHSVAGLCIAIVTAAAAAVGIGEFEIRSSY